MAPLFRSLRTLAPRHTLLRSTQPLRTFTTHPRLSIKEDGNRSAEELDAKKHEQLRKQKEGKGEWHEGLASAGESNIAADKEKVHDHDDHMEDLQKETAEQHEKDHPHGKAEH